MIWALAARDRQCSTPVGVKGISTSPTARIRRRWRRAQRLSASKESPRPRWSANCKTSTRAQRLSASKESPLGFEPQSSRVPSQCSTPVGVKGISTVVDREPWIGRDECSTPVGVKGISTEIIAVLKAIAGVLNACRRQRNLHILLKFDVSQIPVCSTPVGVKGISTLVPLDGQHSFDLVLNACRRQRNLHARRAG